MVGCASLIYLFMWQYFERENRRRGNGREDVKVAGMSEEEVAELGDQSPRFVYTV